jgi:DeoR/GlpR family transcriptional regulator of sugar metabolism
VKGKVDLFAEERQELLLEILRSKGKVFVGNASVHFGVSPDTIRRDLDQFVRVGLASRVHGGALLKANPVGELPHNNKGVEDPKHLIGKKAACLVESNSLVIFDSGLTSLEVAKNLPVGLAFTAVTNSPAVAAVLVSRPSTTVILVSGRILKSSMSIVGDKALAFLKCVHADLCFLEVCAVGLESGVGTLEADELPIKKQMVESSSKVVAVASNEKFSATAPFTVCPLSTVDTIVTNRATPESLLERYQTLGITTMCS